MRGVGGFLHFLAIDGHHSQGNYLLFRELRLVFLCTQVSYDAEVRSAVVKIAQRSRHGSRELDWMHAASLPLSAGQVMELLAWTQASGRMSFPSSGAAAPRIAPSLVVAPHPGGLLLAATQPGRDTLSPAVALAAAQFAHMRQLLTRVADKLCDDSVGLSAASVVSSPLPSADDVQAISSASSPPYSFPPVTLEGRGCRLHVSSHCLRSIEAMLAANISGFNVAIIRSAL